MAASRYRGLTEGPRYLPQTIFTPRAKNEPPETYDIGGLRSHGSQNCVSVAGTNAGKGNTQPPILRFSGIFHTERSRCIYAMYTLGYKRGVLHRRVALR